MCTTAGAGAQPKPEPGAPPGSLTERAGIQGLEQRLPRA